LQGEVLESQLNYWKQQLGGQLPVLELPTDRKRLPNQTYRGTFQSWKLPKHLTEKLKTLSHQSGATLFMTLLAAFKTLLYRYTQQEDIIVGSPIAGRNRVETEKLIGFFVNTLALRTRFQGNPTFRDILSQVRRVALGADAHQDLPFEKLVQELQPARSLSHTPLFQVWFNMLNLGENQLQLSGLAIEQLPIFSSTKFDLTLYVREKKQEIQLDWVYNADMFEAQTIHRMTLHFQTLLEVIVVNPDLPIATLPLLTPRERHQLLVEWNDTIREYPLNKCIHQLFEE
jgi:aspartate racemase